MRIGDVDAPGLDLLAAFVGSEGMLGIVTEVTVKLVPRPATARVIMASFDDVVTGGNAVAAVIALPARSVIWKLVMPRETSVHDPGAPVVTFPRFV